MPTDRATLAFAATVTGDLIHLRALEAPRWTLCGHEAVNVPEHWHDRHDNPSCTRCQRRVVWMRRVGYELEGVGE